MEKFIFRFLSFFSSLIFILGIGSSSVTWALNVPLSLFPLENYEQDIEKWIKPSDPSYRKPLLQPVYQNERLKEFYKTNGFYDFGQRQLDRDELDDFCGTYLIQMLKYL